MLPDNRRFQFSLRAMLVSVMLASAWPAYNANLVYGRRAFLKEHDANVFEPSYSSEPTEPVELSWIRRAMGDQPLDEALFDSESEPGSRAVKQMRWLFPEAIIHLSTGERFLGEPHLRKPRPQRVRTWTVDKGTVFEMHTEWSDGSHSVDTIAKWPQASGEAEPVK
jgi:hypothetical protein